MHNITLIATVHHSSGRCNPEELYQIMLGIRPDIIFEELSQPDLENIYSSDVPSIVEAMAIRLYKESHPLVQIPVDTFPRNRKQDQEIHRLNENLTRQPRSESAAIRALLDKLEQQQAQQGFAFLNSPANDACWANIDGLEKDLLDQVGNERLQAIRQRRIELNENREEQILRNIYDYSRLHVYRQAILFIGSGHRKRIMEKIQKYEAAGERTLHWTFYGQ